MDGDLSRGQIWQLVSLVPWLVSWLRDAIPHSGDMFLLEEKRDGIVDELLRQLIKQYEEGGEPSVAFLRSLLSKYKPEEVAVAVRRIVVECEPRLIPLHTVRGILEQITELNESNTEKECAMILGPFLDELPRSHYYALAELCAFWRDTCSTPSEVACVCGPILFGTSSGFEVQDGDENVAAAILTDLLVTECEGIFGRMAAQSAYPALGQRKGDYYESVAPRTPQARSPRALEAWSTKQIEEELRSKDRMLELVQALRRRNDILRADQVEVIFDNFDFLDIARNLALKFPKSLPDKWTKLLEAAKESDLYKDELWWLTSTEAETNAATNKKRSDRASISATGRLRASSLGKTSLTVSHLGAEASLQSMEERSAVDRVIDELIDTERSYFYCLKETLGFGAHLRNIANGANKDARDKLGLSAKQIDLVFGFQLKGVVELSEKFLALLMVVDLVRDEPQNEIGRIGFVLNAMEAILEDMHIFLPYVSYHKTMHKVIKAAGNEIERKSSGRKLPGPGRSSSDAYKGSFEEKWNNLSSRSKFLKGQHLLSVLIMPVQRPPRYMLLFKDLLKKLPKDHPCYSKLQSVGNDVEEVTEDINLALRKHEKLANVFGDESFLPTGSQRKLVRAGSSRDVKIQNMYPDKPNK